MNYFLLTGKYDGRRLDESAAHPINIDDKAHTWIEEARHQCRPGGSGPRPTNKDLEALSPELTLSQAHCPGLGSTIGLPPGSPWAIVKARRVPQKYEDGFKNSTLDIQIDKCPISIQVRPPPTRPRLGWHGRRYTWML